MPAGMALNGFIPYVNTIATFITRRCYEQVLIDLSLHNLPVRLIGNGGGLVYAPLGPTHQAIEDIGLMRLIPNMTIICPCDANEMKNLMFKTSNHKGPIYIRLAKGGDEIITKKIRSFNIGKAISFGNFKDILILSTGVMSQIALKVKKRLEKENINCSVAHFNTIKPLDENFLKKTIPKCKRIFTLEEHILSGGFGSSILEFCSDKLKKHVNKITRIGIRDGFVEKYGNQELLLDYFNLNEKTIFKNIKRHL